MKDSLEHRQQVSTETITNLRTALQYVVEANDPYLIGMWQFSLGSCLLWRGDLVEAASELHAGLKVANDIAHIFLQNQCLTCLTILHRLQGEPALVRGYLEQLWQILPRLNAPFYQGAAHANQAWLNYRADNLKDAQAEAQKAVTLWGQGSYPFQWLAHWILLVLALQRQAISEAITAAQSMLDPSQYKLPDDVTEALELAVQTWKSDDAAATQAHLSRFMELARKHGYL
jgi:hypothetical protein